MHPMSELVTWKRFFQPSSAPSIFMIGIKIVLKAMGSCAYACQGERFTNSMPWNLADAAGHVILQLEMYFYNCVFTSSSRTWYETNGPNVSLSIESEPIKQPYDHRPHCNSTCQYKTKKSIATYRQVLLESSTT